MAVKRYYSYFSDMVLMGIWPIALLIVTISFVLPETVFSAPIDKLKVALLAWLGWYDRATGLIQEGAWLSYSIGYVLLLCLLLGYVCLRFIAPTKTIPATRFADTICIFAILYLMDLFVSITEIFAPQKALWVFVSFAGFYISLLFIINKRLAVRLVKFLVAIIGVQCLYAVVYYICDIRQFYTPHFGKRTSGTITLIDLYPLCLIGFPLSLMIAETERSQGWRWLWRGVGAVILLALVFTYSRGGWIAFAFSATYLALSPRSPLRSQPFEKWVLIALTAAALLGTIFVRTKGKLIGNPDDRPFWGRFAIWQTAVQIIADHPLLGNGLNTYPQKQQEHMTKRLEHFNPMNVEAKNLYLNLAAELGLVGLAIFCLVAWRYYQLYRFVINTFTPSDEIYKIAIGIHAALIGIAIAGLTDTPILHHTRSATTFSVACLLGILCSLVNQACPAPALDDATLRKRHQRFWRGVGFVAAAFIISFAYLSWHVATGIKEALSAFPKVHELANLPPKLPSFVRLKEIAPVMRDAVIASEDGYFYFHHGVDWLALHRALRKNIRSLRFKQGGSTITMQLARSLFLTRERTLSRKVAEILLALKIERVLPKDRILELYLNTARFGMGEDGIFVAAQNYFGKHPKDLTLPKAAFLAGVLPEPPFDQRQLTSEFVHRCQQRAFERLQIFFPDRYPSEVIREAEQIPLRFVWGTVITPPEGGIKE